MFVDWANGHCSPLCDCLPRDCTAVDGRMCSTRLSIAVLCGTLRFAQDSSGWSCLVNIFPSPNPPSSLDDSHCPFESSARQSWVEGSARMKLWRMIVHRLFLEWTDDGSCHPMTALPGGGAYAVSDDVRTSPIGDGDVLNCFDSADDMDCHLCLQQALCESITQYTQHQVAQISDEHAGDTVVPDSAATADDEGEKLSCETTVECYSCGSLVSH